MGHRLLGNWRVFGPMERPFSVGWRPDYRLARRRARGGGGGTTIYSDPASNLPNGRWWG